MRLHLTLLAAVALLVLTSAATEQPASYMPGAIVTIAVQVDAPPQWAFNPDIPLRLQFDESELKKANFKVDRATWDFKVTGHAESYTAEIPLKISPKFAAEQLDLPLHLDCSICAQDESSCTLISDEVRIELPVKRQAAPGDSSPPAKKGKLLARHALALPQ